ncbi:hypothetical protein RirG_164700 [Rhizophagus irregularis DAOM 197198w]|uniref:BED-type domain-containing protein n=1 Tax=Rhizophagus irregularis (strain DAOM 197198w) TaxID=1432141 RepID=A0A015J5X7_RHIIW|nr:hypothetical protein RirG_164700 [Rhizophagus irregularis DAOM 197198w]
MSGEKRNNEFGESSNPKRYHYKNEEEEELQDIPDLDTEIQNDNQLENKVDDTSNSVLSTLDETNKKTSIVWNHFDKFKDDKGVIWAKCRYCGGGKYNMNNGGSTGNLKRHLKLHPDKFDPSMAKQAEFMKNFLQEGNPQMTFTNKNFRDKLALWVVADDQPFTVVESDEFHDLIKLCNPMALIPLADTVRNDVLDTFKNYQTTMQNLLQNSPGKISFALDRWTSPNVISFLGITCHYIDADWDLKDILVDFVDLSGPHSGENLANVFTKCLQDKKILTKILAITTDNAANNDTFFKEFEKVCNENPGEAQDEDSILENLSSGTISTNKVIPRLRKLIVKIRSWPQRRDRFFRQCNLNPNFKTLNLILDVKMRWNSTYLMLQRAFELQEPLEEITAIDRELEEFTIFTDEWEIIKELCRIFEHMSKSNFITLSSSIPVYNVLLDHLEKLLDTNDRNFCPNLEVRNALRKGYKKLKVYYAKTDDSYVYPIATIFDPRVKLKYYQQQDWEQEYIDAAQKIVTDTYNKNYKNNLCPNFVDESEDQNDFFGIFNLDNNHDEDELEEYLRKPVVAFKTDPLQ